MNRKFAVIGLGDFGYSIALSLAERGAEVIAIDQSMEIIEEVKDKVTFAARLDATEVKPLKALGIDNVDAAIVSIGTNFESTILTSVLLLQMGVKKVIARVNSKIQETILTKLGVHQIINPELEIASKVAFNLINQEVLDYFPLGDDYNIVQIKTPSAFVGKSLQEIDLRIRYNINLITIKRRYEIKSDDNGDTTYKERIYGVPTATTVLESNDVLIVLGKDKDIKKIID